MSAQGLVHPIFLAPFLATQVNAFRAVHKFYKEKASVSSAKNLKRASYPPFMVLLIGFMATTAWQKFIKRRDQDQQEWELGPADQPFVKLEEAYKQMSLLFSFEAKDQKQES
mmetsp:Transcript_7659/g.10844  ORF Transcript_7659/g.10844 Transcript_7659/m.10844 type:complete len:112 (-) Transcript_7659:84-419(-)|eukprot:CAMPEP_0185572292 /NCGR_PEP_ID=MMETSP0434-20130131/4245_1 /TAXON_ID=626734 ORGANISM="Favella taraikaensis, Strain Fe Narragansett Bay" /NCGR_SAMPLE_ID=MMETSP0434 /ASSEMBLY_ACC=CAM_ASM_000379 /LENGTH=111 /DNA_ID=CAMNT_0028188109 /DNA_START=824 /DNA_END=1159 /DNA_ORIENTATION=+